MHWIFLLLGIILVLVSWHYVSRWFVTRKWALSYFSVFPMAMVGIAIVAMFAFGPWLHWKS